jgi:CRISPR-associated protein Csx10
MRSFDLTVRFPTGSLLVGGASATPRGFHASHAQLPDGRPYIPATALRGALRESLETLLRGTGEHQACAGGDGIDPGEASIAGLTADEEPTGEASGEEPTGARGGENPPGRTAGGDPMDPAAGAERTCSLGEGGAPCLACRVFGTRRSMIGDGERAFSALVLGDATPVGAFRWAARPSVAVARASRSAADKQLVFRRIPEAAGEPLRFAARGWVNDAALEPYLEAAARATTHLGAGRSRGLAQVEITVKWDDKRHAREEARPAFTGDLRIRVTLTSPALIGASVVDGNFRETRYEIPGSAVRGAVGFALRALVEGADHDAATQDLLDAERGARFGFLYPADAAPGEAGDRIAGPLPITAAWCKTEQRKHPVVDTLLDRLVLLHAGCAAAAARAVERSATQCRQCPQPQPPPLRTAHGSRLATQPPRTRTVVRVAMDRTRQSARDEQLYSQVLLETSTVLEGSIRGIPAHSRQRLVQVLDSGILSFGRGRSAGWGQACIAIEPAPALRPIAERAAAFDDALRARLEAARIDTDRVGRFVPVTLLSPLWPSCREEGRPDRDDDDGERDLRDAVGDSSCFLAARRFARDGAWDQRTGKMTTFRATAAGGVFVLQLAQATWRDVLGQLETLERDGVGQRRDQGFGQVLCFDPHFLLSAQNG